MADKRDRQPPDAYQRAIGLLARREHSQRELKRKLISRGVDPDKVDAAIERLEGQGWQDDARFAESLVRTRAGAGYGPLRIRAELGTHGLSGEVVDAAFEAGGHDWVEVARRALGRRFSESDLGDPPRRRKAAEFLFRRGFDHDTVRAATSVESDG